MNIGIHVFLSVMVFSGYMHNSKFVESYGSFIPNFLKESLSCSP